MRLSNDEFDANGKLMNGYDYDFQVWVINGIIQNCGHPNNMRPGCCNGDRYRDLPLEAVRVESAHA